MALTPALLLQDPTAQGRAPREIAIDPVTDHAWLLNAPDFDTHVATQAVHFGKAAAVTRPRWPQRHVLVAAQIASQLGPRPAGAPVRLLDVGCGPGPFLVACPTSWDLHGLDIAPTAIARAKQVLPHATLTCEAIETYAGIAGGFDVVTAFALIEHLLDPDAFLRDCARLVRPGGLLVIMTGDRSSEQAVRLGARWPLWWSTGHAQFYSAKSLRAALERVGLVVERTEWRAMFHAVEPASRLTRWAAKWAEVRGDLTTPRWDHVYAYARRPR